MKQWQRVALLLTCFSVLTAGSCGEKRVVTALPIPPERMDCAPAGKRPTIPPEYAIDWAKVTSVLQARQEHDKYVGSVRTREGVVAGYVLDLEGRYFACSTDAQWLRDWQAGIAAND